MSERIFIELSQKFVKNWQILLKTNIDNFTAVLRLTSFPVSGVEIPEKTTCVAVVVTSAVGITLNSVIQSCLP